MEGKTETQLRESQVMRETKILIGGRGLRTRDRQRKRQKRCERDAHGERKRQEERHTYTDRTRERHTQRKRQTVRQTEREREAHREKESQKERDGERQSNLLIQPILSIDRLKDRARADARVKRQRPVHAVLCSASWNCLH